MQELQSVCPTCGHQLLRKRRSRVERLFYRCLYVCDGCGGRFKILRGSPRHLIARLKSKLLKTKHLFRAVGRPLAARKR